MEKKYLIPMVMSAAVAIGAQLFAEKQPRKESNIRKQTQTLEEKAESKPLENNKTLTIKFEIPPLVQQTYQALSVSKPESKPASEKSPVSKLDSKPFPAPQSQYSTNPIIQGEPVKPQVAQITPPKVHINIQMHGFPPQTMQRMYGMSHRPFMHNPQMFMSIPGMRMPGYGGFGMPGYAGFRNPRIPGMPVFSGSPSYRGINCYPYNHTQFHIPTRGFMR